VESSSSADLTHDTLQGDDVIREAVSPGLIPHTTPNDPFEIFHRSTLSEGLQQIDFFVAQQAQAQHAICGQAGACAARAEGLRDAADQSNCSRCAGDSI